MLSIMSSGAGYVQSFGLKSAGNATSLILLFAARF